MTIFAGANCSLCRANRLTFFRHYAELETAQQPARAVSKETRSTKSKNQPPAMCVPRHVKQSAIFWTIEKAAPHDGLLQPYNQAVAI